MLLNELFSFASVSLAAYLVGGIPTGYLIAKWWGIKDIRAHGSGNIGATNVARALGAPFFFLVFFLDAFKASAFLLFAHYLGIATLYLYVAAAALI